MAVVVCSPDIDHLIKAAHSEFVIVIGDIRRKIGRDSVRTDQNVVLFRAERSRFIKDGTVLFIGIAVFLQAFYAFQNLALFVKGAF